MRQVVLILFFAAIATFVYSEEVKRDYSGTFYATEIDSDHVNVRELPSLSAKVRFQVNHDDRVLVAGVSEKQETIGGQTSSWLLIEFAPKGDNQTPQKGWLFGAFTKDCQNLVASTISVAKYTPATKRMGELMDVVVRRNGNTDTYRASPHKLSTQQFVTFTWSEDDEGFKYTDVPGTYVWYPDTNEVRHICYLGTSVESAWVILTDDFKYALEDFGTSPGPRGLSVWTVKGELETFSGSYYHDLEMQGHEITIVYAYNDWNIKDGYIDKETAQHAKAFQSKHFMPEQRSDGLTNTLLVRYRLDLDAKQRKFVDCEYIITQ